MTRALVLYAHPCPESFAGALHQTVVGALEARGWDVDDCDLYAEGFDPVLTGAERRAYHDQAVNTAPVERYVERLKQADALVLVFPVWNFGYPAILKGFLDRVFLPGVSFTIEEGRLAGNLRHVRKLAAVTTYGGDWRRATLTGNPPRRSVMRHLRALVHPLARCRYVALYGMNRADADKRAAFVERVQTEMARL